MSDKVTFTQMASEIGVSERTLTRWRKRPGFPVGERDGRCVLFARADVERWLSTQGRAPALRFRRVAILEARA